MLNFLFGVEIGEKGIMELPQNVTSDKDGEDDTEGLELEEILGPMSRDELEVQQLAIFTQAKCKWPGTTFPSYPHRCLWSNSLPNTRRTSTLFLR